MYSDIVQKGLEGFNTMSQAPERDISKITINYFFWKGQAGILMTALNSTDEQLFHQVALLWFGPLIEVIQNPYC